MMRKATFRSTTDQIKDYNDFAFQNYLCTFADKSRTMNERERSNTQTTDASHETLKSRLSETQKAVWTYCHLHPHTPAYHICMSFGPYPGLDIQRLKTATERAVNNHPIVKATLTTDNEGEPLMVRHDDMPPVVEALETTDDEAEEVRRRFCVPLDFEGGRLYNLLILKTDSGVSLLANFHHTIFDGISMNILLNDISAAYAGMPMRQEDDDLFDVVRKESERRMTAEYDAARQWHETTFPNTPIRSLPPADRYDAGGQQTTFEIFPTNITTEQWETICRQTGYSGNIVSLTAFALFLGCFTGENEVRFSTVFHGRHGKSMQHTVGMMVQTIPVGARWDSKTRLQDMMRDMRWQQARCMVNDIHPFSEVRKHCGGFGEVSFIYQGNTAPQHTFCGFPLKKKFIMPNVSGTSLAIELWFEGDRLDLYAEYDAAIYSREMVVGMIKCMEQVLGSIAKAETVGDIRFVDEQMTARLDALNDTGETPDVSTNVIDMFRHWAATTPNAIAVKDNKRQLSYAQLNAMSDRLAAVLHTTGVGRGSVVALMLPRDATIPLATLAVLKSGAAYLPCPTTEPEAVTREQWEDSEASLIITTDDMIQQAGRIKGPMLSLDIDTMASNTDTEVAEIENDAAPDDLFALFYTSGSTGKPKAVRITHGNVTAYCQWYHDYFQPHTGTVIGAYNTFSFDASISDIFTTLSSGATLVMVPEEMKNDIRALAEYIRENDIEIIDMPTQIGRLFAMHEQCASLRHIVLGGEAVTPFKPAHDYCIYNQYGPTETTVAVTVYRLTGEEKNVPIGTAINGVRLYVVDSMGRRVPIGAPGELWIAGSQVAAGYHKRQEETTATFTDNPFCKEKPFHRVFRTGDIVRYRPDGMLEFLGRRDGMVKIRGFRVELNAVETALRNCTDIEEAAATTFPDGHGGLQIAAFLVSQKDINITKVRQEMLQRLPAAMVPVTMQQIDRLPLTNSGKVDRRSLPQPDMTDDDTFCEPENPTERTICEVFANVLGKERVSADADFFIAGGTSITAVHVLMQLEKKGITVEYADIFRHPSARQLARWVDSGKSENNIDKGADDTSQLQERIAANNAACLDSNDVHELHDVLLTGATGFLGIHVLDELLSHGVNKVWCVVRRTGDETPRKRLLDMLHHYFGTKHDSRFASVVEIIEGDLTNTETFRSIETIESDRLTVINCAAIVKHFAPKDIMERINVEAVNRLGIFCTRHNALLIHISTLNTVMPTGDGGLGTDQKVTETSFSPLPATANPYTTTKWNAEHLLLKAAEKGLRMKIMRMGNLSPRLADGMLQYDYEQNASLNWLRIVALTLCCPLGYLNAPVEFTPVDEAAKAVITLSETSANGNVFHVFCPPKLRVADVIDALDHCGIKVEIVPEEVFAQHLLALSEDDSAGQSLAVAKETASFGTPTFCWDNDFTMQVLARQGHVMPVISHQYAERLIETLSNNGFLTTHN